MTLKSDKERLKRTAIHEVGHALFYILNDWEFQHVSVKSNEQSHGHIRPYEFETILLSGLVSNYFNTPMSTESQEAIAYMLKQHIEISIAGELCSLFYQYRDKDKVFKEFFSLYDYFFGEMGFCNIIEDLVLTAKISDPKDKRKKVRIFAGLNSEILYSSDEYAEIDGDFIESYLALSLFYHRDDKHIRGFYKRTAKRILKVIEEKFELVEYLSSVLIKKKVLTFEQFDRCYSRKISSARNK